MKSIVAEERGFLSQLAFLTRQRIEGGPIEGNVKI
jgi:hypothetical protein